MGKQPKIPQVQFPQPSQTESQIQQLQYNMLHDAWGKANTLFNFAKQDRTSFLNALMDYINSPTQPFSDSQNQFVNDAYNAEKNQLTSDIYNGITGQQLDQQRNNSIAQLASQGVLNSTTGEHVIRDLENQRGQDIYNAMMQANMDRFQNIANLRNQLISTAQNRAAMLGQNYGALDQQYNNTIGNANTTADNLMQQYQNQRIGQYNAASQNAMIGYQNAMNARQSRIGVGSLIGAGLGLALAAPTGGLSLGQGLALGSTLGGGLFSAF